MAKCSIALAALAAATGLFASAAHAQGGSLVGSWRAVLNINGTPVEFDLVVQPNMAFSETQRAQGGMTMQTGEIQPTGPDTIIRVIEDWQPRSMPSYGFDPQLCPGQPCWHQIPTSKPPGGSWKYWFSGPNTVTMHDINFGGNITYQRVG